MIINSSDDMYWKVNGKAFYSKILAMDEAHLSGKNIEFHFYDDWLTDNMADPTNFVSWEEVLLDRAMELREKWKKLRLWYSGGRDSYTALQAFIRNNIVIDELCVIDFNYRFAEYPYIYKSLLKENIKEQVKKITLCPFDVDVQKAIYGKGWEYKNNNTIFIALPPISEIINYYYPANKDWCNITGCEKPRVICDGGKMYSSMNDGTPQFLIGVQNHEPFYISQFVPIFQYQTWNLVNYILTNPKLKRCSDQELNMGLNTIPKNPWEMDNLYYHGCKGALRTEFASYELGLPLGKAFQTEYATKLNLARYEDIEESWKRHYPEINKSFRNGILQVDEAYNKFHQGNDVKYQPLKIHSKRHYLRDRVS